jgi:RNA polymerase sigma-70 factor (ECF subfamily)
MADSVGNQLLEEIPRLRRYARALTGNRDSADDLVQDCLERAWSRLYLWRRGTNLRAWLFTIMHNVHANTVRRARSRPQTTMLPENLDVVVPPSQEDRIELRSLADALAMLSDEHREILLLVGLEELSYAEAGKVLGIPVGTVMSRLSRARARLRELMAARDSGTVSMLR